MITEHQGAEKASRASGWEWAQTAVLVANLIWTTLCLGGYRPETMVVSGALTGVLLAVHFLSRALSRVVEPLHSAGWWLLPFLAYALANIWWVTPVRWLGWIDWWNWAQMLVVFWVMLNGIRRSATRRVVFFALVMLGVVGVALGCYQQFEKPYWLMLGRVQAEQFVGRASGSFGIPNSLAAWLLLLMPVSGALTFRREATAVERVWWGWVTLVFAFGLVLTISRGAWIAFALGLTVWPLTARRWTWRRRIQFAGAAAAAITVVGVIVYRVSPKVQERLTQLVLDTGERSRPILWRGAWTIFRAAPVFGSGAGSYNVFFERHRPDGFRNNPQWAHNEYLNTLSDYGAVGFVLFFGACVAIGWRHRTIPTDIGHRGLDWLNTRSTVVALRIGLLAFALQLFVDFHFKLPALGMAVAVIGALAIGRCRAHATAAAPSTRWMGGMLAGLVAVGLVPIINNYRAEALRYRSRQAIDRYATRRAGDLKELIARGEADLRRAVAINPKNGAAWADLALVIISKAYLLPAKAGEFGTEAERPAREATELSTAVWEFWVRLGTALDMQGRLADGEPCFERSIELAPKHAHAWYYYAYHLSLTPRRDDAALRAIANCLALDPGNAPAEALREQLLQRR